MHATTKSQTVNTDHLSENPIELDRYLQQLSKTADNNAIDRVISLFLNKIKKLEHEIWSDASGITKITQYQNLFKILEKIHQLKSCDERYNFKIVIPVADRPQHLENCLNSLLNLCRTYEYGGTDDNQSYNKISVLIADDSSDKKNIKQHMKLCQIFTQKGIVSEYFGLHEQIQLIKQHSNTLDLSAIVSSPEKLNSVYDFSHKGASIMRNIAYLKLSVESHQLKNSLIYFIDSDQEFCINSIHADDNIYAVNYFHYLNEIFKTQGVSILTGKVVGDPPVSPAVMAANFQLDVLNFISHIKDVSPDKPCQFHQPLQHHADDASYHDMANLFGFTNRPDEVKFHCTLKNEHNNSDCFNDFTEKLSHFFYGEHPTRKTYFNYDKGFTDTKPARTVYTGNYVIKPENLQYFIPFATMKLRMAGPVLGRLLQAELKGKFVSANLPMLHNRTVNTSGLSEYRTGVKINKQNINLGDEFIRQFYGDIMLFSIIQISENNIAIKNLMLSDIHTIVKNTYKKLRQTYNEKHDNILLLKSKIKKQINNPDNWWQQKDQHNAKTTMALNCLEIFLNNIQINFDNNSPAYLDINSTDKVDNQLSKIAHAINQHSNHQACWHKILRSF